MLHYYRCDDCLSSLTHETKTLHLDVHCACGGALEYLGIVRDDGRAIDPTELSACDDRCTSALGVSCRCKCGGANHGTHLTVVVEFDNGKAIVRPADARAIARGAEYRDLVDAARKSIDARYGENVAKFLRRDWIQDKSIWYAIHNEFKAWHKARDYKTHRARVAALNKIINFETKGENE